jgi:Spy/CpxP family protein refolding chaperone
VTSRAGVTAAGPGAAGGLFRAARPQLLAAAVVAGALVAGAALGVAGERARAGQRRAAPARWMDAFAKELALTPPQRAAVDSVLAERDRAIDALVAPVQPAIDTARLRARRQIRARLTPAQQAEFDAYVARMKRDRRR